jgi:hypothetical protein
LSTFNLKMCPIKTKKGKKLVFACTPHRYQYKTFNSWKSNVFVLSYNMDIIVIPCLIILINLLAISLRQGHFSVMYRCCIPYILHKLSNSTNHSPPLLIRIYFKTPYL